MNLDLDDDLANRSAVLPLKLKSESEGESPYGQLTGKNTFQERKPSFASDLPAQAPRRRIIQEITPERNQRTTLVDEEFLQDSSKVIKKERRGKHKPSKQQLQESQENKTPPKIITKMSKTSPNKEQLA